MNWDAIGSAGEVIGAITTVVMLIYLSIQLRQNSSYAQASTEFEVTMQLSNLSKRFADDPELIRIWELVVGNEKSLTEMERNLFLWHMTVAMQICQGVLSQYQRGLLSKSIWDEWERVFAGLLKLPVAHAWWSQRITSFSPEFYDFFDDVLSKDNDWSPMPVNEYFDRKGQASTKREAEDGDT